MNLKKLTENALGEHGFDGLFNIDGPCACKGDDLFPCDSPSANCEPGYIAPCNGSCDSGKCDWHIQREEHQCGGPWEACCLPGCTECGAPEKAPAPLGAGKNGE